MRRHGLTSRMLAGTIILTTLASGCSSSVENAVALATSTTVGVSETSAPESSTSTTPLAPSSTESAGDERREDPEAPTPDPPIDPASEASVAAIAGVLALRNASGDIVIANPDGSDAMTVSSGNGRRLTQPTWSNDGSRLAWSALDSNGAAIEIGSRDGELQITATTATPPFYLSWSTGDSSIGALRPTSGTIEFFFASTIDGTVRPIGAGQPFYFDWRNDEAVIAAVNGTTLVEVPISAELPPIELAQDLSLGVFQAPGIVADEPRRFIAALRRSGFNEVVAFEADGPEARLGRANGPVSIAADSTQQRVAVNVITGEPESQVISFQTDPPPDLPSGRVSIIDLESGDVTTRPESRIVATQWSPDGERLALLQARESGGLGDQEAFQWLVIDGDRVSELTPFTPSQEFAVSYLPFADQYNHSTSWWSPDGLALVMPGAVGEESGIWVDLVDDNKGARLVADGDIAVWSPQ